jgi:DNA-binding transcriptional LysR family regulator
MDTLLNIKAFLATARGGSFSAAARQLAVAPSVIVKRVTRLEDQMQARLFERSTRRLTLTEVGERYLPRYLSIVAEVEEALAGASEAGRGVAGHVRIKTPTTITIHLIGDILADFQVAHPDISLEIVLIDRSVNPIEEGFDLAIGAMPTSYINVVDEPLCPHPRSLCAAPAYLARHDRPAHPRDLADHHCLTFLVTGSTWTFDSPRGPVNVDVHARFSANDSGVLHSAMLRGLGIGIVADYFAKPSIDRGELVALLPDYPVSLLWLKALVPQNKIDRPAVQLLLRWLKARLTALPPYATGAAASPVAD